MDAQKQTKHNCLFKSCSVLRMLNHLKFGDGWGKRKWSEFPVQYIIANSSCEQNMYFLNNV